jgi:HSP20 family protein
MKLDLSRWNPFRFLRKTPEEKRAESGGGQALSAAVSALPAAFPDPSRFAIGDPFRVMFDVLRDPFAGFNQVERWFGDYSPSVFEPRIDVVDDGDGLRITAELPGLDRQDVQIQVEDQALVIRGEKRLESKSEEKGAYRIERAFGSFMRLIPLPDGVDPDRAEAKFDKGVLTIRLPKTAGEKPGTRRIEIK